MHQINKKEAIDVWRELVTYSFFHNIEFKIKCKLVMIYSWTNHDIFLVPVQFSNKIIFLSLSSLYFQILYMYCMLGPHTLNVLYWLINLTAILESLKHESRWSHVSLYTVSSGEEVYCDWWSMWTLYTKSYSKLCLVCCSSSVWSIYMQ